MADFEYGGWSECVEHGLLGEAFGIAGEKEALGAVLEGEDEGIVVGGGAAGGVIGGGAEDVNVDAGNLTALRAAQRTSDL